MRTSHPFEAPPRRRQGFSLVEVIVAMMIVTIGLLGIAGGTTLALRTTIDATRRRDAIGVAQSRIALVAAAGCNRASNGNATDPARHLTEQWSVHAAGPFQEVTDSITWVGAGGTNTFALSTAVLC